MVGGAGEVWWLSSHALSFLLSVQTIKHADLYNVTDSGMSALASAGCGKNLASLTLWGRDDVSCVTISMWVVVLWGGAGVAGWLKWARRMCGGSLTHALFPSSLAQKSKELAALNKLTDSGVGALASAGCGEKLTSLVLGSE